MPDWKQLVRERIGSCESLLENHADTVSELAAHLEETYESAQSRGVA